ncbi:hypothetical protein COO60DRAFT_386610 [Scenedesmus sp. NREL 46B-D3]|nr:hypothetical protein COO60DRAFT_386610 [Scenedesmus sp. NREL 46B-D3]
MTPHRAALALWSTKMVRCWHCRNMPTPDTGLARCKRTWAQSGDMIQLVLASSTSGPAWLQPAAEWRHPTNNLGTRGRHLYMQGSYQAGYAPMPYTIHQPRATAAASSVGCLRTAAVTACRQARETRTGPKQPLCRGALTAWLTGTCYSRSTLIMCLLPVDREYIPQA